MKKNKDIFFRGEEGFKKAEELETKAKIKAEKKVNRFYLKNDTSAEVIFIDDPGLFTFEHNFKYNDSWGNYAICLKEVFDSPCPLCASGNKPYYAGQFTVIDTRSYKRQDGTIVSNQKMLFMAKRVAIKALNDLRKKHGSLVGLKVTLKRFDEKGENTGIPVSGEKVDLKKLFKKELLQPIDYEKVLEPISAEELQKMGFGSTSIFGEDDE